MIFSLDLVTGALSLLFTVMILSYLIGDNPLFKVAVYLFVGVASGYAATIVIWQVLMPKLFLPTWNIIQTGDYSRMILLAAPWLGFAFILMKISPRLAGTARITMAYLVGVGAAVTIVGALTGTIIPQIEATVNFFDGAISKPADQMLEIALSGGVILLGTVTSLAYFHFGARQKPDGSAKRAGVINLLAWVGRVFIGSALGAVFAGVYAAALTALIERIASIVGFLMSIFGRS
ncbi:MAG: hypothetical protein IPG44_08985 [Anaerolineales bacterium]|jgi:hypothetical protein|nr:hypothetical protein [Anaerolineales bacterium]MCC6985935.1 hypothetical protein [Anaerolineales bacterium]